MCYFAGYLAGMTGIWLNAKQVCIQNGSALRGSARRPLDRGLPFPSTCAAGRSSVAADCYLASATSGDIVDAPGEPEAERSCRGASRWALNRDLQYERGLFVGRLAR